MGFRLKTSLQTKEIFEELGNRMNLKPFALSKLAISMSLTNKEPIENLLPYSKNIKDKLK